MATVADTEGRQPGRQPEGGTSLHPSHVLQVVVPAPLRKSFDYACEQPLPAGTRVKVPFGRRTVVGVVISNNPPEANRKLKTAIACGDNVEPFGTTLLELLTWAAEYYHHPLGEVMHAALPVLLRAPAPAGDPSLVETYRVCPGDAADSADLPGARAPLQARIYEHLLQHGPVDAAAFRQHFPGGREALRRLLEKGLVESRREADLPRDRDPGRSDIVLNAEQAAAVAEILHDPDTFRSFALHGVTGSGKTEVYLEVAAGAVAAGRQVLFLVPEISLTPQLVARTRERFGDSVAEMHSAMTPDQRYRSWWLASRGHASVVLGTRSAIFTPLKHPGLIVVDEEHDRSYKQQDGFRYHARDLALKRGSLEHVPVVLGSATPSMETLHNVALGRHQRLDLTQRTGSATLPRVATIDLKQHRPQHGISQPLLQAIRARLERGEQTILYLNRRGYAPLAQCYECGWQAGCSRCDAFLTVHRTRNQLRCHHCGSVRPAPAACEDCGAALHFAGAGTQRVQQHLEERFPDARIARFDRDELTTRKRLEAALDAVQLGETDIIVGTQLITKGHDFSRVTLVGVIDSDQGLYSSDFRAPEHLFQQLVQVSGRAGRADAPGEVLVQTSHPENPNLAFIRGHDFAGFSSACLEERQQGRFPPYSHAVLWRAESTDSGAALDYLAHVAVTGQGLRRRLGLDDVDILDAVPSPMERLAGRYRAQLLVRCDQRKPLHVLLRNWVPAMENDRRSRAVRWSVDVDPVDLY